MSSQKYSELSTLLDKTERNLKRIEMLDDAFNCVALNEWRYATRHVVNLLQGKDEEEERKALGHLKRAYFDSCDVLLDSLLAHVIEAEHAYSGYATLVAAVVPDFQASIQHVYDAQEAHLHAQTRSGNDREVAYDSLEEHCSRLERFVGQLERSRNAWQAEIRKQKQRDRLPVMLTLLGIVVTIALAVIFH